MTGHVKERVVLRSLEYGLAQAAIEEERPKRGDDWRNVARRDEQTVREPQSGSKRQPNRERRNPELWSWLKFREHTRHESRHRSDGEIDPARDQNDRHAQCEQQNRDRFD